MAVQPKTIRQVEQAAQRLIQASEGLDFSFGRMQPLDLYTELVTAAEELKISLAAVRRDRRLSQPSKRK